MKNPLISFRFHLAVAISSAATCGAQVKAVNAADQAWADVTVLATAKPLTRSVNGRSKTPEERKAEIKQQQAASRAAAAAARDFYTKYPDHPKAKVAKKTEAIKALRGIETGNKELEDSAMAIARAYRQNKQFSAWDRFDVALAMDRMERSIRIGSTLAWGRIEDWKNVGENLKNEFGDLPPLQAYLVEIAEHADTASAVSIATSVKQSAVAGPAVKGRAQKVLDRAALVGTSPNLTLNNTDGAALNLAQQKNKVTVLITYSQEDLAPLTAIKRVENVFPPDTQIIYLAMDGNANNASKQQNQMPLAGIVCYAGNGQAAKSVVDSLMLPGGQLPRVYVLNRAGVIAAMGAIEELPNLILKAAG